MNADPEDAEGLSKHSATADQDHTSRDLLTGQGLDTFPDAGVYGQWIIQNRICLVQRVSQSHATPSGILPMMGVMRSGRRYLRLDAKILAAKLGVPDDGLWTANRRRALDMTISYVQAQRAMKLAFHLGPHHYVLTLRLPAES